MTALPTVGEAVRGRSRTITDAEIAFLPALMGAINPLFHDEVTAQETPMQGRILYGPALLGISVGLTEHILAGHVIALREIRSVRFLRPVKCGDTVTATMKITEISPHESKPRAVVSVADEVINQFGEVVMAFERSIVVALGNT